MNRQKDFEKRLMDLAKEEGFEKVSVIPTSEFVFVPEYRVYCEENRCGNYGKNYSCPPYCGTVDEMHKKTADYSWGLVLTTEFEVENALDGAEIKPLKKKHNTMTRSLAKRFEEEQLLEKPFLIMAGPCNLCAECKMPEGLPCPFEEKRASCLSAYCIDVGKLAASAEIPISWGMDKVSFFSICLF